MLIGRFGVRCSINQQVPNHVGSSAPSFQIWIKPEHPNQLTAMFKNLTDVVLSNIFPECDLSWTLFILEAAPALKNFSLSRDRHSVGKMFEDGAERTNVVWEPSKDLKHLNLKLLMLSGFEEEDKVTDYIRLVMERAVGLKRIELWGELSPCLYCYDVDIKRRSRVNEASRHWVKERLMNGSSSSVEIIICSPQKEEKENALTDSVTESSSNLNSVVTDTQIILDWCGHHNVVAKLCVHCNLDAY